MPSPDSPMLQLARQLTELGYEVAHYAAGELPDQPGEQLLLPLLRSGSQSCDLRLICLEDFSGELFAAQGHALPPAPIRTLQFSLLYPFEIAPAQLPGMARLCLELSRYLPYGCFSVSPAEGLCLRYQLLLAEGEPALRQCVDVLDTLAERSQQLLPAFARYLDGLAEVDEILSKLAAFAAAQGAA